MESAQATVIKIPRVPVMRVEERQHTHYVQGHGESAVFHNVSLGFFLILFGSYEALYVGNEPPDIKIGDTVTITITKDQ